jgi:hypothetical protein
MDSFRWISVVLSIILGLGITHLLSAAVGVFRARDRLQLDWVPLVWAGCVFIWQLQFWWGIIELQGIVPQWFLGSFLILVSLTIFLFLAASLILPPARFDENGSLRDSFEHDGRWALIALTAYNGLAIVADWVLWGVSPLSWWGALLLVLALLPLVGALNRNRRVQAAITIIYLPLSIWAALGLSRAAY